MRMFKKSVTVSNSNMFTDSAAALQEQQPQDTDRWTIEPATECFRSFEWSSMAELDGEVIADN